MGNDKAAVPAEGSPEGAFSAPLGESTNPSGEEVVNLSDLPENSAKASLDSSGKKPSAGTADDKVHGEVHLKSLWYFLS